MIIVCGRDGTGKTTLCKSLSFYLCKEYKHFDKPLSMIDAKNEYYDFIDDKNNNTCICDRMYDGEYVYAPLYRGYIPDYLHDIEEKLINGLDNNIFRIYVEADIQDIISRVTIRGEDYVNIDDHKIIKTLYEDFMRQQRLPYIIINTSKFDQTNSLDFAMKAINYFNKINIYNFKDNVFWGNLFGTYIIPFSSNYVGIKKPIGEDSLIVKLLEKTNLIMDCFFVHESILNKIDTTNKIIVGKDISFDDFKYKVLTNIAD